MTKKWSSTKSGDGLTKRAASKRNRCGCHRHVEFSQEFEDHILALAGGPTIEIEGDLMAYLNQPNTK